MKYQITILLLLCTSLLWAKSTVKTPKWVKNARKAQVSVIATNAEGTIHESQGIIVSEKGELITEYDILKNAVKVSVLDYEGKEYPVKEIIGISPIYNAAYICMDMQKKKVEFLNIATTESPKENDIVYILPNVKADDKVPPTNDTIMQVKTFRDSFHYSTLAHMPNERLRNSAVMSQNGTFIGLLQMPSGEGKNGYVLDASFCTSLDIKVMDAGNTDLNNIAIAKRLPEKEQDALSYLYIYYSKYPESDLDYMDMFIQKYPQNSAGYTMKAERLAGQGKYEEAEQIYENGLAQEGIKKDELYHSMSTVIFNLCKRTDYNTYKDWTLETALDKAQKAYGINPSPIYLNQEAECLYVLKKYNEACNTFMKLAQTNLRSSDIFLYAALCKQQEEAPAEEILALQDSAVNYFNKPYPKEAATAILMRAGTLAQMGKYKEAIVDYNEYEHLMGGQNSAKFYYEREQLEMKCRMYPAALNDIERAIRLAPDEPLFYAECAALNYRVGNLDEAISYAEKAIQLDAEFTDAYRIKGICHAEKKEQKDARSCLQKAIDLGDQLAKDVLEQLDNKK